MGLGFIAGSYALLFGMYITAIWDTRGIPGGGSLLNRLVAWLYPAGAVLTLIGCALLVLGLVRSALDPGAV